MNIEAPFSALQEVERVMSFEEKIIRTGVFRVDEISKEPSKLFVSVNAKETKKQ